MEVRFQSVQTFGGAQHEISVIQQAVVELIAQSLTCFFIKVNQHVSADDQIEKAEIRRGINEVQTTERNLLTNVTSNRPFLAVLHEIAISLLRRHSSEQISFVVSTFARDL